MRFQMKTFFFLIIKTIICGMPDIRNTQTKKKPKYCYFKYLQQIQKT